MINNASGQELYQEIDNRTSWDRMRSPLKDGDDISVLPIIKSRMEGRDD